MFSCKELHWNWAFPGVTYGAVRGLSIQFTNSSIITNSPFSSSVGRSPRPWERTGTLDTSSNNSLMGLILITVYVHNFAHIILLLNVTRPRSVLPLIIFFHDNSIIWTLLCSSCNKISVKIGHFSCTNIVFIFYITEIIFISLHFKTKILQNNFTPKSFCKNSISLEIIDMRVYSGFILMLNKIKVLEG